MNRFINLSPQVLKRRIGNVVFSGGTTGYVFPLREILSGGTNGNSLLTELSIPILITETIQDLGYYDTWDGNIIQKEVIDNFIYSANTADTSNKTICLFNTSDNLNNTFLNAQNTIFNIDWGDGSINEIIEDFSPNNLCHTYVDNGEFEITLKAINVFGVIENKKKIKIPLNNPLIISNSNGEISFGGGNNGSWSGTPTSDFFISHLDSENTVAEQTSIPNYIDSGFAITGFTYSRINDLTQYGSSQFSIGPVYLGEEMIGNIICKPCDDGVTIYSLGNPLEGEILFFDYPDGKTIYSATSIGLFSEWLLDEAIVKNEQLLKISDKPEVQSDVFIERGKLSVLEKIQRLGEVDNIGDMERYGYKFFKLKK